MNMQRLGISGTEADKNAKSYFGVCGKEYEKMVVLFLHSGIPLLPRRSKPFLNQNMNLLHQNKSTNFHQTYNDTKPVG